MFGEAAMETRIVLDGPVIGLARDEHQSEEALWTAYTVALARKASCWELCKQTWREYVLTGLRDEAKGRMYHECDSLWTNWREREQAAYAAWQAVAYPLNGLPLD